MNIHIIKADGVEQRRDGERDEIGTLIGADALDTVNLRDGRVMYVDDLGHQNNLPVNAKATALYHSVCYAGTLHQIVGDVAIVRSADL